MKNGVKKFSKGNFPKTFTLTIDFNLALASDHCGQLPCQQLKSTWFFLIFNNWWVMLTAMEQTQCATFEKYRSSRPAIFWILESIGNSLFSTFLLSKLKANANMMWTVKISPKLDIIFLKRSHLDISLFSSYSIFNLHDECEQEVVVTLQKVSQKTFPAQWLLFLDE